MSWINVETFIKDRNDALFSLDCFKIVKFYNKYRIKPPKNAVDFWKKVYEVILKLPEAPVELKKDVRCRLIKLLNKKGTKK